MSTTSPQRENENTRQYVTRLIEEAVALKGEDYVYYPQADECEFLGTTCFYIVDGEPSCIVGHVLVAAGVDPEELSRHEGMAAYGIVRVVPVDWGDDEGLREALQEAQKAQDGGSPWGMALKAYKSKLGVE